MTAYDRSSEQLLIRVINLLFFLFQFSNSAAFITDPVKIDAVTINFETGKPACRFIDSPAFRHFEITDCTAIFTDKMVMKTYICLETVEFTARLDPQDFSLIDQNRGVPVNRTETEFQGLRFSSG